MERSTRDTSTRIWFLFLPALNRKNVRLLGSLKLRNFESPHLLSEADILWFIFTTTAMPNRMTSESATAAQDPIFNWQKRLVCRVWRTQPIHPNPPSWWKSREHCLERHRTCDCLDGWTVDPEMCNFTRIGQHHPLDLIRPSGLSSSALQIVTC